MRHRAWIWVLVVVAVTAGSVATVGLAGPTSTQAAQERGGTLRISRGRDIDSVDPAIAYLPDSWMLEIATCAKLYNYPDKPAPEGAIVIPEVATGFPKISADGKTQTIQLKRTFRFHTGQPVTAANFVAALNRDANPKLQSDATTYLHEVVGADAVIAGSAQTITGVRAPGRYTLQIRTTRPLTDLVSRLTMPFFCPIAINTPLEEIDDPLGSGPYYVSSRVPNRQTVLARNPFYRGSRPASVDQIVLTINGLEACRDAVERNELDYCAGAGIPTASYREVAAKYGVNKKGGQFFFKPTLAMNFFVFNHDRPAFKGEGQIPLKQAINWALDRHALAQAAGYLSGKRTDQILPPALARAAALYPLAGVSERSLTRAQTLMKQAKFRPEKLVLYARNVTYEVVWAQIFRFNLKRLGIDVEIKYFPADTYWGLLGSRGEPFDVAINSWFPDYPDGATFYLPLLYGPGITKTGNQNVGYFDRPKYNTAIERIGRLSGEARHRAWADLDVEMMRDDPPWAPIASGVDRAFVSKSFGCFVFQPAIGRPNLAAACKK